MRAHDNPFKLAIKNNWGTCHKWWGEIWKFDQSCQQLTLEHDTFCFVSGWDILTSSLTFLGYGIYFYLPFDLCHITMTTDPMDPKAAKLPGRVADMFKSCPSKITLTPDSLYHPK